MQVSDADQSSRDDGEELTMPVDGSTVRERVSTAMTCLQDSFQGPYFRQFDVETSSHE